MMEIERAIDILMPSLKPKRTPAEYEEALAMARAALRLIHSMVDGDEELEKEAKDDADCG